MNLIRTAAAALAIATASATVALAAPGDNPMWRAFYQPKVGAFHEMVMDAEKDALIMKYAKKVPADSLVYVHDGQLYIAPNAQLPGGKTLADELAK